MQEVYNYQPVTKKQPNLISQQSNSLFQENKPINHEEQTIYSSLVCGSFENIQNFFMSPDAIANLLSHTQDASNCDPLTPENTPVINLPDNNAMAILVKIPFIPKERIKDAKVKEITFSNLYGGVKFDYLFSGICRGMCDWSIYLYHNTKDKFSDPRSHMSALGNEFAKGGNIYPTLLQGLYLNDGELLKLQLPNFAKPIAYHHYGNPDEFIKKLDCLPAGTYRINISKHVMVAFKIHVNLCFFFNPSAGFTEISRPDQFHLPHIGKTLHALIIEGLQQVNKASCNVTGENWRENFIDVYSITPRQ
jgi:hypothetical protein